MATRNELEVRIKKLREKNKDLGRTNKELIASSKLSNMFITLLTSRYYTVGDILKEAVDKVAEAMQSDSTAVYLIEEDHLVIKAANGIPAQVMRDTRLERGHEYWEVIETGKDYLESNVLVHPVRIFDKTLGVFYINDPKNGIGYTSGNYVGLDNITKLLAIAIQYHSQTLNVVTSLAQTIEKKDPYTMGHSDRVTKYAKIINRELCGGSSKGILLEAAIEVGGVLHDIGKVGIPDSILLKESELTDDEYAIIKQHPLMGAEIVGPALKGTHYGHDVIQLIEQHHERYDGLGYPHGLRGDGTSLIAQIWVVADSFDAMTSDRSYRKGMDLEEVMGIIEEERGKQFSPEVANAFLSVYRNNPREIIRIMETGRA